MPKVLISTSSFGQHDTTPLERLEAAGVDYTLNPHGRKLTVEESATLLAGMDGVIAGTETLNAALFEQVPTLRVISRVGVGMDGVDLNSAAERGIHVYNTPDALTDAVAELALGGLLALLRRTAEADRALRSGTWHKPMGRLLRGSTVGVIGLGRIGKAFVRLLQPFGVKILAHDMIHDEAFAQEYHLQYAGLAELLAESDVVTLHLAYSSDSYHLLDRERLAAMKPGAVIVNCARGGLIDEAALCELIDSGHLGGAYLDTFEQEPYNGPLCQQPNVLLTPHIGSYAVECRTRMEREAVEKVLEFFAGAGA